MYALITGGTSGLGLEIAHYLDSLGYKTIIVGRREFTDSFLNEMIYLNIDLVNDLDKLISILDNYEISIFINNAGIGYLGLSEDEDISIIDVNIKALVILSEYFIKKQSQYLLNVSSIGAYLPGNYINLYYSSKSFVLTYTKNLIDEYPKRNISYLIIGPLKTEFNHRLNAKDDKNAYNPKIVAKKAIDKMFKGRRKIIVGFKVRLVYYFHHLIPHFILKRIVYKSQKEKINK